MSCCLFEEKREVEERRYGARLLSHAFGEGPLTIEMLLLGANHFLCRGLAHGFGQSLSSKAVTSSQQPVIDRLPSHVPCVILRSHCCSCCSSWLLFTEHVTGTTRPRIVLAVLSVSAKVPGVPRWKEDSLFNQFLLARFFYQFLQRHSRRHESRIDRTEILART